MKTYVWNYAISFGIGCILSLGFPVNWVWRLPAVFIASALFASSISSFQVFQSVQADHRRYRQLLAYLAARLSIGETLERALTGSGQAIGSEIDENSLFCQHLQQIGRQVTIQSDLKAALLDFSDKHPWPSVRPLLILLPKMQQLGGRIDLLVRNAHRILAELDAVELEVRAEQSQKSSESIILMAMPFFLAPGMMNLMTHSEQQSLYQNQLSQLIFFLLYLVSCLAIVLVFRCLFASHSTSVLPIHTHQSQIHAHQSQSQSRFQINCRLVEMLGSKLGQFYLHTSNMPGMGLILQAIPEEPKSRVRYFEQKSQLILICLLFSFVWAAIGVLPIAVLILVSPGAALLHDFALLTRRKDQINAYRLDYPLLMNWFVQLLQAGFSIVSVMNISRDGWVQEGVIKHDLDGFFRFLGSGHSVDWAIEQLGEQNPIPELKSFWFTVARYQREGSTELLELMALQAIGGYQMQRIGYRRQLESKRIMVLLPMMLDLLVILGLSIWPALFSLMSQPVF